MPQIKKGDKRVRSDRYWKKRAADWQRRKTNVPTNLPEDIELKDADGKVYMRLIRGKPVELVGTPEKIAELASTADEIEKTVKGVPHVAWTPPPVEFTPPSKGGPVGVGPTVPLSEVVDPEVFAMYGELMNSLVEEKYRSEYKMDVSDARCQRLSMLTARAWPNVAISPRWAWGIAMVLWHGKLIIYTIKFKLKAFVAWLKGLGKKKDEKKPEQNENK